MSRARVNTCAQCVHLTNPCTKQKILSLNKQKDKIYKTKNDNIKNIPPQLYYSSQLRLGHSLFQIIWIKDSYLKLSLFTKDY